jgi:hypothetical protein
VCDRIIYVLYYILAYIQHNREVPLEKKKFEYLGHIYIYIYISDNYLLILYGFSCFLQTESHGTLDYLALIQNNVSM